MCEPLKEFKIQVFELRLGLFDELIRGTLAYASLKDVVYEVFSTVWGHQSVGLPVQINGQLVTMTEYLETALRHIRHQGQLRVLWVISEDIILPFRFNVVSIYWKEL